MSLAINHLVLIPCYQESAHVGAVVREVVALGHKVVVIDDGSTDDTAGVARAAGAEVVIHEKNQGKGAAVSTGLSRALLDPDCEAVVIMDGDGQHLPAEIESFLNECGLSSPQTDDDVDGNVQTSLPACVIGTRMADTRGMPIVRRLTNRFMSSLLSWQMGKKVSDTQCGFRLLSRAVFPLAFECASGGFSAESEILCQLAIRGYEIREVPISTVYGDEKSKIRPVRDTVRFIKMLLRFRSERRKIRRENGGG